MTNATKFKLLFLMAIAWLAVRGGGAIIVDPGGEAYIDTDGFAVLVIEESSERHKLPVEQKNSIIGTAVPQFVAINGGKFRRVDPTETETLDDPWASAVDEFEDEGLPLIVISNTDPVGGYVGEYPENDAAAIELMEQYVD